MADSVLFPNFLAAPTNLRVASGGDVVVTITNKETSAISYKIKTTTPTRYVVRPRSGVISANSAVLITIQHRVGGEATTPNLSVLRDRFKVECIFLPAGTDTSEDGISKLWASKPKSKEIELTCEVNLAGPTPGGANPTAPVTPSVETVQSKSVGAANAPSLPYTPLPSANESKRSDADERIQRLKESEDSLRQANIRLEQELTKERSRVEEALCTAKAKAQEVTKLQQASKKGVVLPLRMFLPILLLACLISYWMGSR